jgi:DNA-binding beta-propeller fold protein YncE
MKNRIALLARALACALALSLPVSAQPRADVLPLGKGAQHAAVDAASGRLFVAHGAGRGDATSVSVVDASGRVTPVVHGPGAAHIAVSARHRRAIAAHPSTNEATVIDLDTMQARTVLTGIAPSRVLLAEGRGLAYVLGKGMAGASGSVTEIDLRSGLARTFALPIPSPASAVLDASGTHLFALGAIAQPGASAQGVLLSFDLVARSVKAVSHAIGRDPWHLLASAAFDEVYVVSHVERDGETRRVLHVLGSDGLVMRRVMPLPPALEAGAADIDAQTNQIYLLDSAEERVTIVDTPWAEVRTVALEARGAALAVNAVARRVIVSFEATGQAGVFSMAGERLDTLAAGRAVPSSGQHFAVDAASGAVHLANRDVGSVATLRMPGDAAPVAVDFTDLWVDPKQPGWGVFLDQQGGTVFATLFTHDPAGHPTWLFMSNGARQPDGSFAGDLHRTRGPLAEALKNVSTVGSLRFEPGLDGHRATLTYYVDGGLHTRSVQRFRSADAPRTCRWSVDGHNVPREAANFTALWSNPADPGWGLAVSHQGGTAFGVLFTYDEQNRPTWAVMASGKLDAHGAFAGDVYRAVGEKIEAAGQMALSFSSAESGILRYRLGGLDFRGPILRQTFSRLTSHCKETVPG